MPTNEQPFEARLQKSLKSYGYNIPVTEEEIIAFEQSLEKGSIPPIPEELNDPAKLLLCQPPKPAQAVIRPIASETRDNLARAAREGQTISDQVRKQMEKDRKEAEGKD